MHYTILYRGPLSSCNYGCAYCPFAKRRESRAELAADRVALERFVGWVDAQGSRGHELSVLFTPWGEALTHRWYQRALVRLTNLPQVRKAAIQTNVSCTLEWVRECDLTKLGLWCSYHPTEVTRDGFLSRCRTLDALGARYSVGVVGLKEHLGDARALRAALKPDVYLWVNAFKRADDYYAPHEHDAFTAIDPLFPVNDTRHPSLGRPCRAGNSVFSVDGAGTMRRCHFIAEPIGNIYVDGWESGLRNRACTNDGCGCHIGYVHLPHLGLYDVFGEGLLERIPATQIWDARAASAAAGANDAASPIESTHRIGHRLVRMSLRQVSTSGL